MERTQLGLLLAKIESSYGVDAAPSASVNNVAVVRSQVTLDISGELLERNILDGGFHRKYGPNVLPEVGLKFRCEARGNRTTGAVDDISKGNSAQAIPLDPLLRACNLAATYTPESGASARDGAVIYKPVVGVDAGDSATIYFYSEKKLYTLTGVKGDLSFMVEAGKFGYFDFDLKGLFTPPLDSSIPSPTWLSLTPPTWDKQSNVVSGSSVTLDGTANTVTLNGHNLFNGDLVKLAGTLPAELSTALWYYVVNRATNTFKLAATRGGTAIDFTGAGSGVTVTTQPNMLINGWNGAVLKRLELKLGNQLAKRMDGNSLYGVKGFAITGRQSSGSINPESVEEATHSFWQHWLTGLVKPCFATLGQGFTLGSGNRLNLGFKAVEQKINYEDDSGLRIQNIAFQTSPDNIGDAYGEDLTFEFK
jgi:hypothetical protein